MLWPAPGAASSATTTLPPCGEEIARSRFRRPASRIAASSAAAWSNRARDIEFHSLERRRWRDDYHFGCRHYRARMRRRAIKIRFRAEIWLRGPLAQAIEPKPSRPSYRANLSDNRPRALVNARLVDPATGKESAGGVLVIGGLIAGLGGSVTAESAPAGPPILHCPGRGVRPGLLHLPRLLLQPGRRP